MLRKLALSLLCLAPTSLLWAQHGGRARGACRQIVAACRDAGLVQGGGRGEARKQWRAAALVGGHKNNGPRFRAARESYWLPPFATNAKDGNPGTSLLLDACDSGNARVRPQTIPDGLAECAGTE